MSPWGFKSWSFVALIWARLSTDCWQQWVVAHYNDPEKKVKRKFKCDTDPADWEQRRLAALADALMASLHIPADDLLEHLKCALQEFDSRDPPPPILIGNTDGLEKKKRKKASGSSEGEEKEEEPEYDVFHAFGTEAPRPKRKRPSTKTATAQSSEPPPETTSTSPAPPAASTSTSTFPTPPVRLFLSSSLSSPFLSLIFTPDSRLVDDPYTDIFFFSQQPPASLSSTFVFDSSLAPIDEATEKEISKSLRKNSSVTRVSSSCPQPLPQSPESPQAGRSNAPAPTNNAAASSSRQPPRRITTYRVEATPVMMPRAPIPSSSTQRQRAHPPASPLPLQNPYGPASMRMTEPYAPYPQRPANPEFTPGYASQLAMLGMRGTRSYAKYRSSTGSMSASPGIFDYSSSEESRWTPASSASPMIPPAYIQHPTHVHPREYAPAPAPGRCEPEHYDSQSQYSYQHNALPQQSSNHMNTPASFHTADTSSQPIEFPHTAQSPPSFTTTTPPTLPANSFTSQPTQHGFDIPGLEESWNTPSLDTQQGNVAYVDAAQWNAAPDVNANPYDSFASGEWPATSQGNVGSYYDEGLNEASSSLALPSAGPMGYGEMVPMQVPMGQQGLEYDDQVRQQQVYHGQQPYYDAIQEPGSVSGYEGVGGYMG